MRNYKAKNVDDYIANSPKEGQAKLTEIRKVIKTAVPDAEEEISWGVPFYKYYGLLAGYSVFRDHISLGFNDYLDSEVRKSLEEKGYVTGKKTIQIKFDQKVPAGTISQMLKSKAKSNEVKKAIK